MAEERLHKVMAAAGFGSRRACEQMIIEGHVAVDGRTVSEVGVKVDPALCSILVDGKALSVPTRHIYIKLNKPRGVISDIGGDTGSHKSVASLLPEDMRRVFPVGRLDLNSEGLILLTDDGELAHHLTHPSFEHPKTYYVLVDEQPSVVELETLRTGVPLPEGRSAPARVRTVEGLPVELLLAKGPTKGVWLEITLREGKKRQIRHMLAAVNHPVSRLVRFGIGPLTMGRVKPGEWTKLGAREAAQLRTFAGLAPNLEVEEEAEVEPQREQRGRSGGRAAGAAAGAAAARGTTRSGKPYAARSGGSGSSSSERSGPSRPYTPRAGSSSGSSERSGSSRPYTPRAGSSSSSGSSERSGSSRPYTPRAGSSSGSSERSGSSRPGASRSGSNERPGSGGRPGGSRPSSSSRPYTPRTSSGGKPASGKPGSRPTGSTPNRKPASSSSKRAEDEE